MEELNNNVENTTSIQENNEKTLAVVETKVQNNKKIRSNSFPMDNHLAELPMFLNSKYNKNKKESINLDDHVVLKKLYNIYDIIDNDAMESRIFDKKDSNINRKLFMFNTGRLPRDFEQDVLHALIVIFVQKNGGFSCDKDGCYNITTDKVYFTFYEICKILKVKNATFYIEKIKKAINILKTTQYYSFGEGVFFDKSKNAYVVSNQKGMSWIAEYEFLSVRTAKDSSRDEKQYNWVQFGHFMIHNLKYGYFKYLGADLDLFFSLSSGLTRSIYSYINKNMYDNKGRKLKYIKRFYDTLMFKLGLSFKYPSQLKIRLKKPMDELIENGMIKDYFFGDEVLVNGVAEPCIYICSTSKARVIAELNKKRQDKIRQLSFLTDDSPTKDCDDKHSYLKVPRSFRKTLLDFNISANVVEKLIKNNDRWTLATYIIWANKQIKTNKVENNISGLLRAAIEGKFPIQAANPEIIDYVELEKKNYENEKSKKKNSIEKLYNDYINKEIANFEKETPDIFILMKDTLLADIETRLNENIKNIKLLNGDTKELEEFKSKKEKSAYFKNQFIKQIKIMKNLKSIEEFKMDFENEKSKEQEE